MGYALVILLSLVAMAARAELATRPSLAVREEAICRLPKDVTAVQISVSADGRHYAYIKPVDWKVVVVVDGIEHEYRCDWIVDSRLLFTADSRHTVYQARNRDLRCMVIDGAAAKSNDRVMAYERITEWVCGETGRLMYAAAMDGRYMAVVDGVEGKRYDYVRMGAIGGPGRWPRTSPRAAPASARS